VYLLQMPALKGALADVVEASHEAVSLAEFAHEALRSLQRAFDCTLGCVTHSPSNGTIEIISATDPVALGEYHREWFDVDPINSALSHDDVSWIVPASRLPQWQVMRCHPLYAEWAPSKDADFLIHLRLSEAPYLRAGATNIFLCRARRLGDFGYRDVATLSQVMPDMETAVKRCGRIAAIGADSPFLESLLDDAEGRARFALRGDGRLLWASRSARRMLPGCFGRGRSLPSAFAGAVQKASGSIVATTFGFSVAGKSPVTATLRTAFSKGGERFVVVDLHGRSRRLPEPLGERYGLTAAEANILADLGEGLSNAEIARRRSVAITTVRTHVGHILSKLGVRSRLQAGLLARAEMY
jgi:DNA-binding CsgD family transcriptional regulator